MKSIVSYPNRGEYGNNKYRGNVTGKLLIDLHSVYKFDEISERVARCEEKTKNAQDRIDKLESKSRFEVIR